jgi:hypothetical protein
MVMGDFAFARRHKPLHKLLADFNPSPISPVLIGKSAAPLFDPDFRELYPAMRV